MSFAPQFPDSVSEETRVLASHCPACYAFFVTDDSAMLRIASDDRLLDKMMADSFTRWFKNCPTQAEKRRLKFSHGKTNCSPNGTFAGTLTMAPTDPTNEEEMVMAIRKIFRQKTCPVKQYVWYLEYTENGLPHIHFIYRTPTGGRIHAKVFKRLWKLWDESIACGAGHRGGYHRLCHDEDAYKTYIAKCSGRHEDQWTST